ncbi:MAG: tRNA-dihydrouridine synthase [Eubacterium sp.]|nr:tRNA-dihydrouridine synthase [Candidatus Colimonas fimequi]
MVKTNFLGLELKNPLIVSAGPWNRDGGALVKSINAGAGAVVTESVVSDTLLDVRPRIACDDKGAQNIRLYSDIQIEGWEREIALAKNAGGIVIGSVSAQTPSELAYLASKMERYGCDAIELSVSNPAMESLEVVASHPDVMYEMTKEVVSSVKVPVMVKLSQNTTNIATVAKAVKAAGGAGVSAINTVRGILGVDIETAKPALSTYGGISGEYIRPLGLASVATIAQTVDIPLCGIGGVSSAENALEYIMLGASAVQVGTAVMREGYEVIGKIARDLENWMEIHGYDSVEQVRGKALRNMKSFDEMKFEPAVSTVEDMPCVDECNRCYTVCVYDAIKMNENNVTVDKNECSGCGLCTFACPARKLRLKW